MKRFIVELAIGLAILLIECCLVGGWPGVIGWVIGSVIGTCFVALDYRRKHKRATH